MYGRKIGFWGLHLGLLCVVVGALTGWQTARSDRMFLRPGVELTLYGFTAESDEEGHLAINGEPTDFSPSNPVYAGQWELKQLRLLPDGTLAIALRSDPWGRPLVFAGYALFALGGAIGLRRRVWLPVGVGVLCAVAALAWMQFFDLSPALRSPWFPVHVGLIFGAYMLLLSLPVMKPARARTLLPSAVWLLGLGIVAGSLWADGAWGRYWGWDPKETGALVLLLLYSLPLHFERLGQRRWFYVVPLLLLPLLLILPGLHSYLF